MRLRSLSICLLSLSIGWSQTPNQVGIAHVALRVAELEPTRTFYNRLGFEQFFEQKQGDR